MVVLAGYIGDLRTDRKYIGVLRYKCSSNQQMIEGISGGSTDGEVWMVRFRFARSDGTGRTLIQACIDHWFIFGNQSSMSLEDSGSSY